MMHASEWLMARKYARAFLNVYSAQVQVDDIMPLQAAENILQGAPLTSMNSLQTMSSDAKTDVIMNILEKYNLSSLKPVVDLLMRHKHIALLPLVIRYIRQLYIEQNNILSFVIYSSHTLSEQTQKKLSAFLARVTGKDIIYTCVIDRTLIAGIKLQSRTLTWEYSVRKQLSTLYNVHRV